MKGCGVPKVRLRSPDLSDGRVSCGLRSRPFPPSPLVGIRVAGSDVLGAIHWTVVCFLSPLSPSSYLLSPPSYHYDRLSVSVCSFRLCVLSLSLNSDAGQSCTHVRSPHPCVLSRVCTSVAGRSHLSCCILFFTRLLRGANQCVCLYYCHFFLN